MLLRRCVFFFLILLATGRKLFKIIISKLPEKRDDKTTQFGPFCHDDNKVPKINVSHSEFSRKCTWHLDNVLLDIGHDTMTAKL